MFVQNRLEELEAAYDKTRLRAIECMDVQRKIENNILDSLQEDVEAILQDDKLVEFLSASYVQQKRITRAL